MQEAEAATKETQEHTDNKAASSSTYVERFESAAKLLVGLAAALYGLGLLVSNVYFIQLGLSDFSSLRPKYIFTGLWAVTLIAATSLPVFLTLWSSRKTLSAGHVALLIILGFVLSVAGAFVFNLGLELPFQAALLAAVALVAEVNISLLGLLWIRKEVANDKNPIEMWLIPFVLGVIGSCVVTVLALAGLYGRLPEGLGGGKPITARLVLTQEGKAFWKEAAMAPTGQDALSTGPLQIFYQNDHELAVGVLDQTARENNPRIIIIDRKFVAAIVLQKVPRWFRLTRLP